MKLTINNILATAAVFGVCFVAVDRVHGQVPQISSDSGVRLQQGVTMGNDTTTTVKAPSRHPVSTELLLEDLAADETINGTWFNADAKVPANAKLEVTFAGLGDFSSLSYKVVSGTKTVDVSNIISAAPAGTNDLNSASYVTANGANVPPFTATDYRLYTISYDSRPVGGKLWFTVTGLATSSAKTTKPNAKGVYTETDSFSLVNGTGSGVDSIGDAFLLSGVTVTASGTAKITPQQVGVNDGSWESSVGDGSISISAPSEPPLNGTIAAPASPPPPPAPPIVPK